jgi:iron complex transport system substrate-binding protein
VVNLEPMCLQDVFACIRQVAEAAGVPHRGEQVVARLQARVEAVAQRSRGLARRPRVALLEWLDPPFCCGHWSPELVRLAGGVEGLGREGQPSRTLAWQEVVAYDPEVLVLACCGFSVERTLEDIPLLCSYPGFADLSCTRQGRVYVLDGSAYFSRPGPRLVDSLEILAHILHPEVHPLPFPKPPYQRLQLAVAPRSGAGPG